MKKRPGSAILFDFDGVLIDSTAIKTDAYRHLFSGYGGEIVEKIIDHHQHHAGISRVEKITHAHKHFVPAPFSQEKVDKDVEEYSKLVFEAVVHAEWVEGAREFVTSTHENTPLFIISGTPESELQEITRQRGMAGYFKEILGSPVRKPEHIRALLKKYNLIAEHCFFVGDALTDYNAARETGMPFIGIHSEIDFPEHTVVLPDCTELARTMAEFSTIKKS